VTQNTENEDSGGLFDWLWNMEDEDGREMAAAMDEGYRNGEFSVEVR
jgi:hypothetical protein